MLSLLGAALGFGTSIIPSILDLFQQKQKDAQELKMLEAKGKYAAQLSSLKLDELDAKADSMSTGVTFNDAAQEIWNDDTNLLFTSIISFWFGSRQFAKLRKNAK